MKPASLAIVMGFALSLVAQSPEIFKARLSPVPIEATTRANIAGIGSATATLVGSKLSIVGKFEGLRSPATDAKVHQGPVTGVRGPAILDVTVDHTASGGTSGAIHASLDLTPQQIESLKKGRLYIQIDSEKAPDGNLWGWLLR
jgi:hypothetical protein